MPVRAQRPIGSTTQVTVRALITGTPTWQKNMEPVLDPTGSHVTRPVVILQQQRPTGRQACSRGIGVLQVLKQVCRIRQAYLTRTAPAAVMQDRAAHRFQIGAGQAAHLPQTASGAVVTRLTAVHAVRRSTGVPVPGVHRAVVPARMGVREVERVVAADGDVESRMMR